MSTPEDVETHGWLRDTFDGHDHPYTRPPGLKDQGPVNLREKHPNCWDPPYDQLSLNACVGNATAAAYRFEVKKFIAEHPEGPDYERNPSRVFIYYNARAAGEPEHSKVELRTDIVRVKHEGTYVRTAMKGLHKFGVCSEHYWPYVPTEAAYKEAETKTAETAAPADMTAAEWDTKRAELWKDFKQTSSEPANVRPAKEYYAIAEYNRIAGYERLDVQRTIAKRVELGKSDPDEERNKDGKILAKNLRLALTDGHPVVFGFFYYAENPWIRDTDNRYTLVPLPGRHQEPAGKWGKHVVLAIGYNDDRVLCQNSWGPTYGPADGISDGLFNMPWSYITDFEATNDFWIITSLRGKTDVPNAEDLKDAQDEAEAVAAMKAKQDAAESKA
jgi:hypothetical protein